MGPKTPGLTRGYLGEYKLMIIVLLTAHKFFFVLASQSVFHVDTSLRLTLRRSNDDLIAKIHT
jgi:hypothetical protein